MARHLEMCLLCCILKLFRVYTSLRLLEKFPIFFLEDSEFLSFPRFSKHSWCDLQHYVVYKGFIYVVFVK